MASISKKICKDCGCECRGCCVDHQTTLHLHVEIENLQQRLLERENHIVKMETNFLTEAEKFPNGEFVAMMEEVQVWQDKYNRLYEAHKKLQKVNQSLEDKLLKVVDKFETEKNSLSRDLSSVSRSLAEERAKNSRLQAENERYRNDVNLTIQLLQCKPSNFMPQKFDSLPADLQQKVKLYVSSRRSGCSSNGSYQQPKPEVRTIKVPIPTFPPTAMVYSINKTTTEKESGPYDGRNPGGRPVDIVSAAIMAKVLEERERERCQQQHCETCRCPSVNSHADTRDQECQTSDHSHTSVTTVPVRSNILLDSVVGFRANNTSQEVKSSMLGSSCRSAVLVHSPRCRNNSSSSSESHKLMGESSETSTETEI